MEQTTICNDCKYEFLVDVDELGFADGEGFECPACGSDDTTCI